MLSNWLLLLCLLPGWLLPSGAIVPLCVCRFTPAAARSCCVAPETPACCAPTGPARDGSEGEGARLGQHAACSCSVAVPTQEGKSACPVPGHAGLAAPLPGALPGFGATALVRARVGIDRDRPRGPRPGGPLPLPLRL